MTQHHSPGRASKGWRAIAGLLLLPLAACSVLRTAPTPPATFYALDNLPSALRAPAPVDAPTLLINPPRAAAGFDSQRIIYLREPHRLDYFAHSEWVDPPPRMLGPLLVAALQNTGAFHAVVLMPSTATGQVRLDTEILRLQHEFLGHPSRARFTLRATLVDDKTRRVLGWREFDQSVAATGDDPAGGVAAANRAVQAVLQEVADFCVETLRGSPDDAVHFGAFSD